MQCLYMVFTGSFLSLLVEHFVDGGLLVESLNVPLEIIGAKVFDLLIQRQAEQWGQQCHIVPPPRL